VDLANAKAFFGDRSLQDQPYGTEPGDFYVDRCCKGPPCQYGASCSGFSGLAVLRRQVLVEMDGRG
jgi:hypothetical protein